MELLVANFDYGCLSVLMNDKNQVLEVSASENDSEDIGDIYVGRVEQVKKNINSAFVRIADGRKVFVSIGEDKPVFYVRRQGTYKTLVEGDEILVQIEKEAHKTKLAKASTAFVLTGRYVILTTDRAKIFVSSKIKDDRQRLKLKKIYKPHVTADYGFIIRTNAAEADPKEVMDEIQSLIDQFNAITENLSYKALYQKVHGVDPVYMTMLRNLKEEGSITVRTSDKTIADQVSASSETMSLNAEVVKEESCEDMLNRYGLRDKLAKLLHRKIWLKSGASIIIDPTEAMTVIDVNTEKSVSRKNSQGTILKTNLEAADMIMYQLRSRNINGIVIVDFIDMATETDKKTLMDQLITLAKEASLKTTIHGMTTLGLVEITRKKQSKPLAENNVIKKYLEM